MVSEVTVTFSQHSMLLERFGNVYLEYRSRGSMLIPVLLYDIKLGEDEPWA
jgi:protein-S-isoprenylcysteine O-methyltransferase Ste14